MEPVWFMIIWSCIMGLVILVFLLRIVPSYKKNHQISGGVINHNGTGTKFVFRISMKKEEIERQLSRTSGCIFRAEDATLQISVDWVEFTYHVSIQECPEFCIVRLSEIRRIGRGLPLYGLNIFFAENLNAEIIPYNMYGI